MLTRLSHRLAKYEARVVSPFYTILVTGFPILGDCRPTFLDELKAVADVTLIRNKEKPTLQMSLARGGFILGHFRTERDTATDNTLRFGRYIPILEIGSRISFAGMGCKRAPVLCLLVLRKCVAEVVVTVWICTERRIVFRRSNVYGCTAFPASHKSSPEELTTKSRR